MFCALSLSRKYRTGMIWSGLGGAGRVWTMRPLPPPPSLAPLVLMLGLRGREPGRAPKFADITAGWLWVDCGLPTAVSGIRDGKAELMTSCVRGTVGDISMAEDAGEYATADGNAFVACWASGEEPLGAWCTPRGSGAIWNESTEEALCWDKLARGDRDL